MIIINNRTIGGTALRQDTTRLAAVALLTSAALLAGGCAETGGASNGGGQSVPPGSDKQAYVDALADMDPITLTMQSTAPKGAATGRRFEEYAAAVEDWSGGKITFELYFSNAAAPVAEVDDALVDGRLDIGSVVVALEPQQYPANNALGDLSFIGSQQPVEGLLQWHGAMIQTAVESDEVQQEFADNGLHALLPAFSSGSYFLDCVEPGTALSDLSGRTIATQSRTQSSEAEELDMSPATISYSEMFESLQRGVVDCAASSLTTSSLGGFIPEAPYFAYAPEEGLGSPGGAIAIGQSRWESLPLAAQQLLQDRIDVLLQANFEATWENVQTALAAIEESDGAVSELDGDAQAAIADANADVLETVRGEHGDLAESLLAAEESWSQEVADLGIEGVDVDYAGFRDWYSRGTPDLTAYFAELQDVLSTQRPS